MSDQAEANEFEIIQTQPDILQLMSEACKIHAPTIIWMKWLEGSRALIRTRLTGLSEASDVFYLEIPGNWKVKDFYREMMGHEMDLIISMALSTSQIVFKTQFLNIDRSRIKLQTPVGLNKIQRRNFHRYRLPLNSLMNVEFSDPLVSERFLTKRMIDISATGLSFEVSREESDSFPIDQVIHKIKFTVENRSIEVGGKVRHCQPLTGREGKFKVGVQFEDIRVGHQDAIAAFVFRQSTKKFAQLL